jgi:glycosidase
MVVRQPGKYPSLYELNIRATLGELSRKLGRFATFDDIPSAQLDLLADLGFDWVWLMSVWQTGPAGRRISRTLSHLREGYSEALPDFDENDICGSPYAVASYKVPTDFGGDEGLARVRERLRDRGMRLLLDFVPNHTAIDHPWVHEHPEFYVRGSQADLEHAPSNYLFLADLGVFAFGRDPYFPGWPDTLQLNYGNDLLQQAMQRELMRIADVCDGVRCDMAMLVTPEVFQKTWGIQMRPFWPETIETVRNTHPGFVFLAEVYWDLEWNLQQQGFDYTYDKRLYDRLRSGDARAVQAHLIAGIDFQQRLARFLENHDEPRAAAVFPMEMHQAAALITYFTPGMRFFHDGQLEGRRIRASVHLCRRAEEAGDKSLAKFYAQLLNWLRSDLFRNGNWQLLEAPQPFLAFAWRHRQNQRLVIVNFGPEPAQCRLDFAGSPHQIDLSGWGYHVSEIIAA